MSSFDELIKQGEKKPVPKHDDIHDAIDRMEQPKVQLTKEEIEAARKKYNIATEAPKKAPVKESYFDKVKAKMDDQRKAKIREPQPGDITEDDRKNLTEKFIESRGLSKKEAKRMLKGEKSTVIDIQKFLISFVAVSMFALVMLWSYAPKNDVIMIIVTIIGSALFLPIGMVLGWLLLDPYMRCKIARKITHKNFGIVNFVGKPNRVTGRIKNFDDDLIWIKTKCWAISKQGIYEVDKNGERATEGNILDPESFILVTETVPIMFVDINSMTPLRLEGDGRDPVSPEEIASILKGWIDAQMAKLMFMKKTMNIMLIIAICAAAAGAYFGYMNNTSMEELTGMVKSLQSQVSILQQTITNSTALPP